MPPLLLGLALAIGAPALRDPARPDPPVGERACVSRTFDGQPDDPVGCGVVRHVFRRAGATD